MVQKVRHYTCGYCTQREASFKKSGSFNMQQFGANSIVFEHQNGVVAFDTGYATHFMDAVKTFPYSLYAKLIPVYFSPEESLKSQLKKDGFNPKDVTHIIVSHFHGDHYAGLKDFPYSKVLCSRNGYDYVKNLSGLRAASKGFLPQMLPADLETRLQFCEDKTTRALPDSMAPFTEGYDLFGDKSIIAIPLEGHARGQIGLFADNTFFIADAVWSMDFYAEGREQSFVADLITDNVHEQRMNLAKIRKLYERRGVRIIYGHQKWGN